MRRADRLFPRLFAQGRPTEVTLRFGADGTCYALVRRDRWQNQPTSAVLGVGKPDYTEWQWRDLGEDFNSFGGPNFIDIPPGPNGERHQSLVSVDGTGEMVSYQVGRLDASLVKAEIEAFLECIETGRRPVVSGEDGLLALETAIRIGEFVGPGALVG